MGNGWHGDLAIPNAFTDAFPEANHNRRAVPRQDIVQLDQKFPISKRYLLSLCLPWIAVLTALVLVVAFTDSEIPITGRNWRFFSEANQEGLMFIGAVLLVIGVKILYVAAYRASYSYLIENGRFVMTKGLLFRQRDSFPLGTHTDLLIGRTWRDLLCGLYYLEILTPSSRTGTSARIVGLTKLTALKLQRFLGRVIESRPVLAELEAKGPLSAVDM